MTDLTEAGLKQTLRDYGGPRSKLLMDDPKMFKVTFDILKGMASSDTPSKVIAISSAVASGASTTAKFVDAPKTTQGELRAASMALSTFKASMDLTKLTKITSVGAAVT